MTGSTNACWTTVSPTVGCMCSSRRQPSSSDPLHPPEIDGAYDLVQQIRKNLTQAAARLTGPMDFTPDAEDLFAQTHHAMTGYRFAGAMGKQSARWAPQVYKLAIVYAAVDGAAHIDAPHLAAARSAWAYNHRSAAAFFAGMTGNQHADQLLQMWRDADYTDLTLTDIDEMFSKHMSAHRRGKMLDRVVRDGLISKTSVQRPGAGRPSTVISFNGLTDDKAPAAAW